VQILYDPRTAFVCSIVVQDLFDVRHRGNEQEYADWLLLKNGLLPQNYKTFLFGMRKNMTNYVAFLHKFAPRVLTTKRWRNTTLMNNACMGGPAAFEELLSVSDEAFMLVVMENYIVPWYTAAMSKGPDAQLKVSSTTSNIGAQLVCY